MSETVNDNDRDQMLLQFHAQFPRPTAADVIEWVERYPQYAEDIRLHAAISRDWDAADAMEVPDPELISDAMMARAHSRMLNALYRSERKAHAETADVVPDFHEMLQADGREIYQLARDLNVGRDVLHDLFNGWMAPPVGRRLVDAVCASFRITALAFDRAVERAIANPRFGQAKSAAAPSVRRRSYEEIINTSNMKDDRKKFWLEDD